MSRPINGRRVDESVMPPLTLPPELGPDTYLDHLEAAIDRRSRRHARARPCPHCGKFPDDPPQPEHDAAPAGEKR